MSFSGQILYVDDDVEGSKMMEMWLSDFRVATAYCGQHAKELIQRTRFDLHIIDYYLSDMTAKELCSYIRSISPRVPIFIYSAVSRQAERLAVRDAGATRYFTKPNDLDRLIPEIGRCLGNYRRLSERQGRRAASSIL